MNKLSKNTYLSMIIPCYNESERIISSLEKLDAFCREFPHTVEIIVINDGSTDSTEQTVTDFTQSKPYFRIMTIRHQGKAEAIKAGVQAAKGEYILFADADLSTPISAVTDLLQFVTSGDYEIAIGSREQKGAKRINEPNFRHWLGRSFNYIVRTFLLPRYHDTQCGFKLFTKDSARVLFSELTQSNNYVSNRPYTGAFDVELLLLADKMGFRVKEVPVIWTYSKTKNVNPIKDFPLVFKELTNLLWNKLRGKYRHKFIFRGEN